MYIIYIYVYLKKNVKMNMRINFRKKIFYIYVCIMNYWDV